MLIRFLSLICNCCSVVKLNPKLLNDLNVVCRCLGKMITVLQFY